jgi:hypothetical protein
MNGTVFWDVIPCSPVNFLPDYTALHPRLLQTNDDIRDEQGPFKGTHEDYNQFPSSTKGDDVRQDLRTADLYNVRGVKINFM